MLDSESGCESYRLKMMRKRGRDVGLVVGFSSVRRECERNIRAKDL